MNSIGYTPELYDSYTPRSPQSVLDAGCGVGTWLRVARQLGADRIRGLDGPHVLFFPMQIGTDEFRATDLALVSTVKEHFDLAMSMEVAEHLPAEKAPQFVRFLCDSAPVVLFSAAVPHQGGTSHVNEQWQSYWAGLFEMYGYLGIDCIRPPVWTNPKMSYYYAQSAVLYVARAVLEDYPGLLSEYRSRGSSVMSMVHPRRWDEANSAHGLGLSRIVALLPLVALRSAIVALRGLVPAKMYRGMRRVWWSRFAGQ